MSVSVIAIAITLLVAYYFLLGILFGLYVVGKVSGSGDPKDFRRPELIAVFLLALIWPLVFPLIVWTKLLNFLVDQP